MLKNYYLNTDATTNPHYNHEVHTEDCTYLPSPKNRIYLGLFNSPRDAVNAAERFYYNVDGCAVCCPSCHRE